jgi:hypothetical protein
MASQYAISQIEKPTCSIFYISLKLGRDDYTPARMTRFVQKLVDERGFPKPYPLLRGKNLIEDCNTRSRWSRDAVDLWLHDFLPPEAAAAADAATIAAAGADMDANAGNLKLIRGGRS